MDVMTEVDVRTLGLPSSRPLTYADLASLPDDGHRYELIDGTLLVSPSPSDPHQGAVGELHLLLRAACPPELKVILAPYDIKLDDDTTLIPDLLVARRADVTHHFLPVAPVLAIEVLSPSTRRFDLLSKRSRYEEAGTGSYWVVDPIAMTLTAWDLVDDRFVEVATVSGDEEYAAERPFPVTVRPGALRY